jgi:hypothetical protein
MVKSNKTAGVVQTPPPHKERVGTKIRGIEDLGENDFLRNPTGHPFKDPFDYMEGKRIDDGIPSHLWRIHDKLYDLESFDHPGYAAIMHNLLHH